jgi:phenylacetate-CoA ligase
MSVQGQLLIENLGEAGVSPRLVATNPGAGVFSRIRYLRAVVEELRFLVALTRGMATSDVVHVLGASWFYFVAKVVPAIVVGRLLGRRVVVNYRGGQVREFLTRYGRGVRFILRRAHALTVPSPFLARVFTDWGLHSDVVPNIVDLKRFTFRARGTLRPRILVSRTLAPIYNVSLAIDAFTRIRQARPDATLTIAAAGPLESQLRAQVVRLGLEAVTFCGSVSHAEMPGVYDDHDVYINPTTVDNMPISLLECLAAGLPVVSTNVGGIPDLLTTGEHGILVPPNDPDAMAAAVLSLLDDAAEAARLAEAGKQHVAQFQWTSVWPRLLRVYVPCD